MCAACDSRRLVRLCEACPNYACDECFAKVAGPNAPDRRRCSQRCLCAPANDEKHDAKNEAKEKDKAKDKAKVTEKEDVMMEEEKKEKEEKEEKEEEEKEEEKEEKKNQRKAVKEGKKDKQHRREIAARDAIYSALRGGGHVCKDGGQWLRVEGNPVKIRDDLWSGDALVWKKAKPHLVVKVHHQYLIATPSRQGLFRIVFSQSFSSSPLTLVISTDG